MEKNWENPRLAPAPGKDGSATASLDGRSPLFLPRRGGGPRRLGLEDLAALSIAGAVPPPGPGNLHIFILPGGFFSKFPDLEVRHILTSSVASPGARLYVFESQSVYFSKQKEHYLPNTIKPNCLIQLPNCTICPIAQEKSNNAGKYKNESEVTQILSSRKVMLLIFDIKQLMSFQSFCFRGKIHVTSKLPF